MVNLLMAAEEFIQWALDSRRTDDEAYFAERVVELGVARWHWHHAGRMPSSYIHSLMDYKKERRRNPAHRVVLERSDVERAIEALSKDPELSLLCFEDRPIRDISGLRFFPYLRKLFSESTEITDLTPLAAVPQLERLMFHDAVIEDLRPLSALTRLRYLDISCGRPWPIVDGLHTMESLEELTWQGNLLPLEGLGTFPRLRRVRLTTRDNALPLRDLSRLPEMPALDLLAVNALDRLDGLERYPRLRNLNLNGCFSDLRPLTSLPSLTHVSLSSTSAFDLAPLSQLHELRWVKIKTEHPCDLYALTDAPKLREVVVEGCEANVRELPTLRAVLSSWNEDFLVPQPRPLAPMRYVMRSPATEAMLVCSPAPDPNGFYDDTEMQLSEARWFTQRLNAAIQRATNNPRWGDISHSTAFPKRELFVTVHSLASAEALPDLFEVMRRTMAECRYPHLLKFNIRLTADWHTREEEWRTPADIAAEHDRERREEKERKQREEAELREREYRYRQLRREGIKFDPLEFGPPPVPPAISDYDGENPIEDDYYDEEPHPWAAQYKMYGILTEKGFFASRKWVDACERVLGRKMERTPDKTP